MYKKCNRFKKIEIIKKRRKEEEEEEEDERKNGKKGKTQNCKSPTQRQRFITIKIVAVYTHIHPQAKSKHPNKSKVQQIDPVNKGNHKLYLPEQN